MATVLQNMITAVQSKQEQIDKAERVRMYLIKRREYWPAISDHYVVVQARSRATSVKGRLLLEPRRQRIAGGPASFP